MTREMPERRSLPRSPEVLLGELGIIRPQDIDVEAIAQFYGATVVYEPLRGCDARLVGYSDAAIITVDPSSRRERQRFSAAHELGHWIRDRGRAMFACTDDLFATEWSRDNPERRANDFAAELLLPETMFRREAKDRGITFVSVRDLAQVFMTSLTATAIRLVQLGSFPALICCYDQHSRRWFRRGEDVPEVLWPHEHLSADTVAYDLLAGRVVDAEPVEVYADSWFEFEGADRVHVVEHSIQVTSELALSLLWWKDENILLELDGDAEERGRERSGSVP